MEGKNSLAAAGNKRLSGLELFRIITMLLIVAHHYVVNSGIIGTITSDPTAPQSIFLLLFGAWGKVGINCFVLITGYFMCESKLTVKRYAKLLLEVEFYRLLIYFIFVLTGYQAFSFRELLTMAMPISSINTGFTSCFLAFYLLIPFLNILIKNMTQRQHLLLLLVCCFIYVLLGSIPSFPLVMNYVSWFVVIYFIGAYLRRYSNRLLDSTKLWGFAALGLLAISAVSVVAITWLAARLNKFNLGLAYFFLSDSNKILAVALAVSAFLFFKNWKLKYNRWINQIAASCFGVLLIHAHSDAMRTFLWQDLLHCPEAGGLPMWQLALHALFSVIGVYVICTILDQLRIWLIEKPFFKLWDRCAGKTAGKQ